MREIDKALSDGVNVAFLSNMNIREKTLQKISERFQGVWAFTKLAMVDTKSRLSVTRPLMFIVQQSTTGSFLSFCLCLFLSLCLFSFRVSVSTSLFLFVLLCPFYVPCSAVTKRLLLKTALNEISR